ncbi:MAG TPA: homoserine dehydrogenase [Candidatus Dormibacteraeota bacterium]|jgi:homoserine dehydrogenase
MAAADLGVGLIGAGTVGAEVADRLLTWGPTIRRRAGAGLELRRVAVRDLARARPRVPAALLTDDPHQVIDDPAIDIVVEVAGGEEPARSWIERAIRARKHVVTANKVVMAAHGPELLELAGEMDVDVYFEAAVGGGIPLISTFKVDLAANQLERVTAIINGTTNYMLCRMAAEGSTFAEVLADAQREGFAEADPSADVDGHDAAAKLAIMASIAFGARVHPRDVYCEGIRAVQPVDFRYARELGYAIKLIAWAERTPRGVEARVHPCLVPLAHPLAAVDGVHNAVFIEGDLVGQVLLQGLGAGARPTTSAVIGDLIDLARSIQRQVRNRAPFTFDDIAVVPMAEVTTRAYFRCTVADQPGVLAQIFTVFGEEQVSISSAIQKEVFEGEASAEFVVATHPAPDAALRRTRERIAALPPVRAVSSFIRVL